MNIVFRVDSSSEIGHGHLMRCMVLALELESRGASIHFICREHDGSAHIVTNRAGYSTHLLPGKHIVSKSDDPKDWLGTTQMEDADACNRLLATLTDCHVIVDHYGLDATWESRIECESLTVIDDLADRPHHCTRLIDQSLVNTKLNYQNLVQREFEFCGGPNILLRGEFRTSGDWEDTCDPSILLCMGGADPHGVTVRIASALVTWAKDRPSDSLARRLDVIIGSAFDAEEELRECLVRCAIPHITVHRGHPSVATLMSRSSLSILSCGTMILEACALGAPAIGIPLADNQKATASFLFDRDAILRLELNPELEHKLIESLTTVIGSPELRSTLSENAKLMVNKNAASLIADYFKHEL